MRRSPGVTKTAGLNDLFGGGAQADGVRADLAMQIPAGRIGQTEEIANAVLSWHPTMQVLSTLSNSSPMTA